MNTSRQRLVDKPAERRPQEDDTRIAEYEDMLAIDEHALEDALTAQPDAFYRVAKALAMAVSRRDGAKVGLADLEAEVARDIRRAAEIAEEKITVSEVDAQCRLDRRVRAARADLLDRERDVGQWQALKEAFVQRSYAIKDLAALYVASYYGDVVQDRGTGQVKNVGANRAREEMSRIRRRE